MGARLLATMHHAQWVAMHDVLEDMKLSIYKPEDIEANKTVLHAITAAAIAAGAYYQRQNLQPPYRT